MLRTRLLTVLLMLPPCAPVLAAAYQLDPSHTYPQFEVDHLGFSTQRGQFDRVRGTLEYDSVQRTGRLEVVIDASSLDTGHDERDAVLKGPAWFDVSRHPAITFRSLRFLFGQDQPEAIEGELTMLGVTQPMRLKIARFKCGLNLVSRKRACGADASGTLRRSQFGMQTGLPFVGDEVRLHIQAEAHLENRM